MNFNALKLSWLGLCKSLIVQPHRTETLADDTTL